MSINAITGYENTINTGVTSVTTKPVTTPETTDNSVSEAVSTAVNSNEVGFSDTAAIYEKSEEASADTRVTKKDRSAIIAQLQADQEARTKQLMDIVQQTISQQGNVLGQADSIWSFLAKGDFTVTPEVKAQAQADIAEDGYWGVEQTSDRIVDFAKALAEDDASKAEELLEAFKEGFSQATKSWGQNLPDISQKTFEAVEKKFNEWMGKTEEETEEAAKNETIKENNEAAKEAVKETAASKAAEIANQDPTKTIA